MNVVLFILMLLCFWIIRIVIHSLAKTFYRLKKTDLSSALAVGIFAVLFAVGMSFVYPLLLQVSLRVLFDYSVGYWIAYGSICLLNALTAPLTSSEEKE